MDYGHAINPDKNDDLNLENWGANMPSAPFSHPTIVSSETPAMVTGESSGVMNSAPVKTHESPARLENDPLAPPPMGQVVQISSAVEPLTATPENPSVIRTDGDHLSSAAIAEIDNAVSELGQTGDLATFYDKVQSLTEANLENSFNRKIGDAH